MQHVNCCSADSACALLALRFCWHTTLVQECCQGCSRAAQCCCAAGQTSKSCLIRSHMGLGLLYCCTRLANGCFSRLELQRMNSTRCMAHGAGTHGTLNVCSHVQMLHQCRQQGMADCCGLSEDHLWCQYTTCLHPHRSHALRDRRLRAQTTRQRHKCIHNARQFFFDPLSVQVEVRGRCVAHQRDLK